MTRQDYATPPELLAAVEQQFGALAWDLACHEGNRIPGVRGGFTPADDALAQDWSLLEGNLWVNPPFRRIAPWVELAAERAQDQRWTLALAPASVDSEWFAAHVHERALVLPLRQRVTFVGESQPFIKPLMLAAFGFGCVGFRPWAWKREAAW